MKIIELDLTGCKNLDEIHERIRVAFDFPDWYGKNWDAFWDLLWSECDASKVIIKGENSLPKEFSESISTIHKILEEKIIFNKTHNFNNFSYEILS